MTQTKLHKIYQEMTLKSIKDFLGDTSNLYLGCVASIMLASFLDYIKKYNPVAFESLKKQCCIIDLLDISNTLKHCELDMSRNQYKDRIPIINNHQQITQEDHDGLFNAPFGYAYFGEASKVQITLNENLKQTLDSPVLLEDIIKNSQLSIEKEIDFNGNS